MDVYQRIPALLVCCGLFVTIILSAPTIPDREADVKVDLGTTEASDTNVSPVKFTETTVAPRNTVNAVTYEESVTEGEESGSTATAKSGGSLPLSETTVSEKASSLSVTTAPPVTSDSLQNETNDVVSYAINITKDIVNAERNFTNNLINTISNITTYINTAVQNITDEIKSSINSSFSTNQVNKNDSSEISSDFSQTVDIKKSHGQFGSLFSQSVDVDNSLIVNGISGAVGPRKASRVTLTSSEDVATILKQLTARRRRAANEPTVIPDETRSYMDGTTEEAIPIPKETTEADTSTAKESVRATTEADTETPGTSSDTTVHPGETTSQLQTTAPLLAANSLLNETNDAISFAINITNDIIDAEKNLTNSAINTISNITKYINSAVRNLTDEIKSRINDTISQNQVVTNDSSEISSDFSKTVDIKNSQGKFSSLFSQSLDADNSLIVNGVPAAIGTQKASRATLTSSGNVAAILKRPTDRHRRAADEPTVIPDETVDDPTAGLETAKVHTTTAAGLLTESATPVETTTRPAPTTRKANMQFSNDSQIASVLSLTLEVNNTQGDFDSVFSESLEVDNSKDKFDSVFSESLEVDNSQGKLNSIFSQELILNKSQGQLNSHLSENLEVDTAQNEFESLFQQNLMFNNSQNEFSSHFSRNLAVNNSESQSEAFASQLFPGSFDNCVLTPDDPSCQNRDGEWGPWSSFSECSPLCVQSRHRACDSPKPLGNGTMCEGEFLEKRSCDVDECKPAQPLSDDMGCYHIGHKYYHSGDANNTQTECDQKCADDDRLFSGVHDVECFCSNVASDGDDLYKTNDTLCTSPCPGDSTETCGGADIENSVSSLKRTHTSYVGCYEMSDYSNEFATKLPSSDKDKSNFCANECSDKRFRYSMTNKTHCACINNLDTAAKKTAESACDDEDKKEAESSDLNGISNLLGALFDRGASGTKRVKRTTFELHSVKSGIDLGCYKATLLDKQIRIDTENAESAVNDCVEACDDHGFPLAAVQNLLSGPFVCQCSRGITQDAVTESHCDSFCGRHRCGSDKFESYYSAKCGEEFHLGSSITPFNTNASTDLYNRTGSRITWVTSFSAPSNALPSSLGESLNVNRTALSLQVDLNTPRLVRQLQFSGHARKPVGVTRFVMAVTVDGSLWSFIKVPGTNTHQEFTGSGDGVGLNSITTFNFPHLIAVKSARVYILDFKTFPAFRIDFIGCNDNI